jgi:hypothetical protein
VREQPEWLYISGPNTKTVIRFSEVIAIKYGDREIDVDAVYKVFGMQTTGPVLAIYCRHIEQPIVVLNNDAKKVLDRIVSGLGLAEPG